MGFGDFFSGQGDMSGTLSKGFQQPAQPAVPRVMSQTATPGGAAGPVSGAMQGVTPALTQANRPNFNAATGAGGAMASGIMGPGMFNGRWSNGEGGVPNASQGGLGGAVQGALSKLGGGAIAGGALWQKMLPQLQQQMQQRYPGAFPSNPNAPVDMGTSFSWQQAQQNKQLQQNPGFAGPRGWQQGDAGDLMRREAQMNQQPQLQMPQQLQQPRPMQRKTTLAAPRGLSRSRR